MLPRVPTTACASQLAFVLASTFAQARPLPTAEISALGGVSMRHQSEANASYNDAFSQSVQLRSFAGPSLAFAAYYHRGTHPIEHPASTIGLPSDQRLPSLDAFSLGLRVEPSVWFGQDMRLWGILGLGWGRLSLPKMQTQSAYQSFTVPSRSGVFVEAPIGLGASYQLLSRFLSIQVEVTAAPISKQSGDLHTSISLVTPGGHLQTIGGIPQQDIAMSFLVGASFQL